MAAPSVPSSSSSSSSSPSSRLATLPAWLSQPSKTWLNATRRQRHMILVATFTIISTIMLLCYRPPAIVRTALGAIAPNHASSNHNNDNDPTAPPPPMYRLFDIPNFDADVQVRLVDVYFNQTADESAIPIEQDLGEDLDPAYNKLRLDSAVFVSDNGTVAMRPEEYISQHASAMTTTVTADIAQIPDKPADASHFLFGMSTSLDRIPENLRNIGHWAGGTGARFVVAVPKREDNKEEENEEEGEKNKRSRQQTRQKRRPGGGPSTIEEATALFVKAGIPDVTFVEVQHGWINGYVELIGHLHEHVTPGVTRWVSWIDDDTFILRMSSLLAALDRFDTSLPYYVGQVSENKWNVDRGGIVAVGGAGVFLTVPLLDQIAPHKEACYMHNLDGGGDGRLADCIYRFTTTKLTPLQGLYQLDLHGDVTGFYEAPRRQPLSVHHWKSWHRHDIPTVAKVSEVCGDACVLQHFRFGDGWRMTNGFSVFRYSDGYTFLDSDAAGRERKDGGDEKQEEKEEEEKEGEGGDEDADADALAWKVPVPGAMEHTWKKTIWDQPDSWKYSLEPLMDRDDGKIQYMMERLTRDDQGNMVLDYVWRPKDAVGKGLIRVRLMAAVS